MTDSEIEDKIKRVQGLSGMTVNERLFVTGLMPEFDKSLKRDKNKARKILELLKVDKLSIDRIVK